MKHKVLWLGVVLAALFWQTAAAADCDYCTAIQGTSPPYRTVTDLAGGENSNLLIRMALLYHGAIADIEATDDNGWTMLHWAVEVVNNDSYGGYGAQYTWGSGNLNQINFNEQVYQAAKVYMHKRANPNKVNHAGETALMRAVLKNDERMVNILLGNEILTADDLHSDLSVQNRFANTEQNNDDIIGTLPYQKNVIGGFSPLMYAVRHADFAIVSAVWQALMDLGGDVNDTDNDGNTALFHSASRVDSNSIGRLLAYTPGINMTTVNNAGENLLQHVIHHNHITLMLDITSIADSTAAFYNYQNADGYTPLMLAAQLGRTEIVGIMITRTRVSPYINNTRERNAFMEAAYFGHTDILRLLYDRYGVNADGEIRSPQYADFNVPQTINVAYMDAVDDSGASALLAAADGGHSAAVWFLVGVGANPDIKSNAGNTPLLYIAKNNDVESLSPFIIEEVLNPNLANADGITPLMLAASLGHVDFVKALLIFSDVDPFLLDNNGLSALSHARSQDTDKHREIVKSLRERIGKL